LVLAGGVLFLLGCEQKSINHIFADPQRYATVYVSGRHGLGTAFEEIDPALSELTGQSF
jgi:hypothetical protein